MAINDVFDAAVLRPAKLQCKDKILSPEKFDSFKIKMRNGRVE